MLLIAVSSFVDADAQSMLKVRLADNRRINLSIDGRYFNKTGTSVTVGDLPYGRHMLKIFAMGQTRRGRAYEEVVYRGWVETYEGMITLFYYDPYTGRPDTKEEYVSNYVRDHPPTTTGEWHGETGGNSQDYTRSNAPDQSNNSEPASPVASPVPPDVTATLTTGKLNKLKTKVSAKKVDTEKMNLLKDALKDETVTSEQVGDIMNWFEFESSKVDFAEWAYTKTSDKENFSDLGAKLTYQKYRDELNKFLGSQK